MGRPIGTREIPSLPARLLLQRPERVAESWRCARYVEDGPESRQSVLEDVLISFLREVGAQLAGTPGSPWERTRGVLKLCAHEGTGPIYRELATLRRVLDDALDVLKASVRERLIANAAIDEALASAVTAFDHLLHPERPAQDLHFGGVVVERFVPLAQRARADGELDIDEDEWEERTAPAA